MVRVNYCNKILDYFYYFGTNWPGQSKVKMKKLNKSIFILGLGVTGMSLAQNLGVRFTRITCWDDNELKRKEAMKKNLVIVNPSIKNFRNIDLIITSPGINHNKKNLILLSNMQHN